METTIVSTDNKANGTISRYTIGDDGDRTRDITPIGTSLNAMAAAAPLGETVVKNEGLYDDKIGAVEETINSSMYNNSFEATVGITAGELLVEGAVNIGKELAKASGATAGNKNAVLAYMNLTEDVLAMDAAADRLDRSPLDITSKNTFLGSIVHKLAVSSLKSGSLLNKVSSISRVTIGSIASLLPTVNAEDNESDLYLANFGDCETLKTIGAEGSATCTAIMTFDTDTYGGEYGNIYANGDFEQFISDNLKNDGNGNYSVKDDSDLARYVKYNEKRVTPTGLMDGGILNTIPDNQQCKETFITKAASFIRNLLGLSEKAASGSLSSCQKSISSGAEFVDDGGETWNTKYKYAQRYISLARAAETMRQYDGDENAYMFDGFGKDDPIARYVDELNQDEIASNN